MEARRAFLDHRTACCMAAEVEDRCIMDDQCALTEVMWSAVSGMLTSYIGFLSLPQEWTDSVKKVRLFACNIPSGGVGMQARCL